MSNKLLNVLGTNNGLSFFLSNANATDGNLTTNAIYIKSSVGVGFVLWDMGALYQIKNIKSKFQAICNNGVNDTVKLYISPDNSVWTQVWGYQNTDTGVTSRDDTIAASIRYVKGECNSVSGLSTELDMYEVQAFTIDATMFLMF